MFIIAWWILKNLKFEIKKLLNFDTFTEFIIKKEYSQIVKWKGTKWDFIEIENKTMVVITLLNSLSTSSIVKAMLSL